MVVEILQLLRFSVLRQVAGVVPDTPSAERSTA